MLSLPTVYLLRRNAGYQRQMRQRVSVDVKDQSLTEALRKLADETGANLIIDPRQNDKAKAKISLQLDDVTLESAIRLLSELSDLNSVRVGNVTFVTTEQRADKLRKENRETNNSNNNFGMPFFGGAIGPIPPPPPPLPPAVAVPPPVEKKDAT
jgi:type II secretory pathway component HofQ